MDMLPPEAPPAQVAHANQSAIAALERMRDTQQWLVTLKDALPEMVAGREGRDAFLADLDAFWDVLVADAPGMPAIPRRQALARRLAQATRDDASLRRNDGTFPDEAMAWVSLVALSSAGSLPNEVRAEELLVGDMPYAGALVLRSDRDPSRVLLFMSDGGWQAFDSLDALYRDVEWTMRTRLVGRDDLPGIGTNDLLPVLGTRFLRVRAIEDDVFETLARRLVARQRERVVTAFDEGNTSTALNDRLYAAMEPGAMLDMHAIVRQRDLAFAERRDEERLIAQPTRVRDHWRQMALAYRDRWRLDGGDLRIPSLASFAENVLGKALRAHGIDAPPHDLRVRLTRRVPDAPLGNAISGFPHEDLSLLALAYRNVGSLPTEHLEIMGADGATRNDVPAETVRQIVRGLDLPDLYARHLDDAFGTTDTGRQRRTSHNEWLEARMRFEAADARLAYYDASEPRSFQDDHQERGFQWVQAVLDGSSPATRRTIDGHAIVVYQLTYKGAPLAGVFMVTARQAAAVRRVVLYTPDAPDGRAFREFGSRAEMTRDFLLEPRFETYLLDRLPTVFTAFDARGRRHFKRPLINGGRDWHWVFGIEECKSRDGCTGLEERFQEREVTGSFLDAAFDANLNLAKRNANDIARSTAVADWDGVFDIWGWNVPFQLAKEFVVGTVQSVPHTAQAGWRFYDDVKSGDALGAYLAFVEGYTSALNILPLYTQVPRSVGASMRATPGSRAIVPSHRGVPAADTLFEKRFLARGVALPEGRPSAAGVFTIDGNRYVRQGGEMYHVRFDPDIGGWRLNRPGALDARFSGPAIEWRPDGQWHFRRIGLAGGYGGAPTLSAMLEDVKPLLADPALLSADAAALTDPQRAVLIDALYRRLPPRDFVLTLQIRLDRARDAVVLTHEQQQAWNEALRTARAARAAAAEVQPFLDPDAMGWMLPGLPQQHRVPLHAWPSAVYAYLPPHALARARGPTSISLSQLRIEEVASGVPVTTLPPSTPLAEVAANMLPLLPREVTARNGATLGSAAGGWVRIDLQVLRSKEALARQGYHLYPVRGTNGDGFLLRPLSKVAGDGTGRKSVVFSDSPATLGGLEFQVEYPAP
ncbi:dermonecrotic toxin domain-containing protein [Luteibacter sp. NPDC031894]|uniref:dermonecrotic toxin domain-containing protein n=1 Tax=Luteibacter sp. NPDC031894 TaxID=3390572 RepID=UPI003D04FAA8